MGLANKGSSKITVNGVDYRWVVSGNDGFLDLVVEQADGRGQRLTVQFDYVYGDMTPGGVRKIIVAALDVGWVPSRCGTQLYCRLDGDRLIPMQKVRQTWSTPDGEYRSRAEEARKVDET